MPRTRTRCLVFESAFWLLCTVIAPPPVFAANWVDIFGSVRTNDGIPICAMVLANGQYMFSCDGTGAYHLNVPLDANGEVTVFAFADGFAPFSVTAGPSGIPASLRLIEAASYCQTSDPTSDNQSPNCPSNGWVEDTPSYEIDEEVEQYNLFQIDGRYFEAKTLCLGWYEGQRIIFDDGRAPSSSYCISATLYNLDKKETCDVWCK